MFHFMYDYYGKNLTISRTSVQNCLEVAESILINTPNNKVLPVFNSNTGEQVAEAGLYPTWWMQRTGRPIVEDVYFEYPNPSC